MLCYISPYYSPYFNLALEEALFESKECFLLYRNSPCVVVGKYQNAYQEVNYPYCVLNSIPILRRESGGGAVYHDLGNINFSVISSSDSITVEYDFLDYLAKALNELDVNAARKNDIDIYIGDKKISGNAQRKAKNKALHHGTLLYSADLQRMHYVFCKREGVFTSKAVQSRRADVTNISEHIKNPLSVNDFVRALAMRFCDSVQEIPNDIIERASELEAKYKCFEWNMAKSPAFTYSFESEQAKVSYSVKSGIIQAFELSWAYGNESRIAQALTGATLDFYEISKIINLLDFLREEEAKLLLTCILGGSMKKEVVMPKLSPAMESGMLCCWLKAEGEAIKAGEPLFEVETDKVVVQVEATADGTVEKLLVEEGDTVQVNTPVAIINS
jgi:lipoate-protein ligase A